MLFLIVLIFNMILPLEDSNKITIATKYRANCSNYICSNADMNFMNIRIIIPIFSLIAIMLLSFESFGQSPVNFKEREQARADSIRKVDRDLKKRQESKDKYRMNNAKDASKETKEKARELKRVERDASNASDQAKKALKDEKKAQRSRKKANDQAKKASEARDKSDRN